MEPTQLQLVFNVVTITGVTSLAGYCYLLKKENRKLASERKRPITEAVQPSPRPAGHPQLRRRQDGMDQNFASARRNRWVKGLASSISR